MEFLRQFLKMLIESLRPKPEPTPMPVPQPPSDWKSELLILHNQARTSQGLPPLTENSMLNSAAQSHSDWMAATGKTTHDQPGVTFGQRIRKTGYNYSTAGENIAAGQKTPQTVTNAWLKSNGHRMNILNGSFKEIGMGRSVSDGRIYWTVNFATRRTAFQRTFESHIATVICAGPLEET